MKKTQISIFGILLLFVFVTWWNAYSTVTYIENNRYQFRPQSIVDGGYDVALVFYPDLPQSGSSVVFSFEYTRYLPGNGTAQKFQPKSVVVDYLEEDNRYRKLTVEQADLEYRITYPGKPTRVVADGLVFVVPKQTFANIAFYVVTNNPLFVIMNAIFGLYVGYVGLKISRRKK